VSASERFFAHASAFYELIHSINGQNPDQIAFSRTAEAYRCADIVTMDDEFNWANAIARQFYCNVYEYLRLQRLSNATWSPLANLAKRICAEQAIHVDHITTWMEHLGKGTEDSKERLQTALDLYAPSASMMFETPEGIDLLFTGGILINDGCLFTAWKEYVDNIVEGTGLIILVEPCEGVGGRNGKHDADFVHALSELQEVFATDPLAAW